jgi:hypothetical protein
MFTELKGGHFCVWTWGVGPVWLLPSATEDTLGGEKFGIGPTGVALKQQGSWTYGMLANHIWSVAGDDDRADTPENGPEGFGGRFQFTFIFPKF